MVVTVFLMHATTLTLVDAGVPLKHLICLLLTGLECFKIVFDDLNQQKVLLQGWLLVIHMMCLLPQQGTFVLVETTIIGCSGPNHGKCYGWVLSSFEYKFASIH